MEKPSCPEEVNENYLNLRINTDVIKLIYYIMSLSKIPNDIIINEIFPIHIVLNQKIYLKT